MNKGTFLGVHLSLFMIMNDHHRVRGVDSADREVNYHSSQYWRDEQVFQISRSMQHSSIYLRYASRPFYFYVDKYHCSLMQPIVLLPWASWSPRYMPLNWFSSWLDDYPIDPCYIASTSSSLGSSREREYRLVTDETTYSTHIFSASAHNSTSQN